MDDVVHQKVAGLDIHEKTIVACVLYTPDGKIKAKKEFSTFPTTTKGLLTLSDWLDTFGIELVAMESTGVYWKCVWRILQNNFELILANPRLIKGIPGKKTDMKDAEWIARLTRIGVIPRSFVPPEPIQELRDWTRLRKRLREDITREKNRAHGVLQCAGIKLAGVMKDIFGKSGRNLLNILVEGREITQKIIQENVYSTLKLKIPQLMDALDGFMTEHSRHLLTIHLETIDFLEKQLEQVECCIDECLAPYQEYVEILEAMPGIKRTTSATVIAEIGVDMSVFPHSGHLTSWAGVCPGNNESAGKQKSRRIRKGNRYLKKVLSQAVHAIAKGKPNRIHSFFWRIARNTGYKKAIIATCGLYLRMIYEMFQGNTRYIEFGEDYQKRKRNLTA